LRKWIAILGVASVLGGTVGSAMVFIAIQHNPQEEFVSHATGAIDYAGLSAIFLPWFVLIGLAAGLLVWVLSD
jgi:hypothetical protein